MEGLDGCWFAGLPWPRLRGLRLDWLDRENITKRERGKQISAVRLVR